jgi:hypothetical protein
MTALHPAQTSHVSSPRSSHSGATGTTGDVEARLHQFLDPRLSNATMGTATRPTHEESTSNS